jgi:EmrB/QacA subfamily drug resistance transporter
MEHIDSTVIATSLPLIARDLGRDPLVLKLGLSAYLVSLAVFIPVSGWFADRFGARPVFCAAIAIFMGSSMLCGFAGSFAFFVAARFLQGVGGAMMVPVGRIIIVKTVPRDELVTALNYLTIPAMLGPMLGPPLGGLITTYINWRWIFFINVPISLLGIVLALRFMQDVRETVVPPLDGAGFVLSATGLSLLMFGLSTINERVISHELAAACIVFGTAATVTHFRLARHKPVPLLDLSLFKVKTFWVGVGGGSLYRIGIAAISLVLPLMFQLGFGLNPLQSGMLTCAAAFGSLFMKSAIKFFLRLYGFRSVLFWNVFLASGSVAVMGLFTARTPHWLVFSVLLVGGCIRTLQFTGLNAIAYADIPDQDVSKATSLFATVQQLSLGMGVTIGAFAVQASSFLQGHKVVVAEDFWPAFLVLGIIVVSSVYSIRTLAPEAGADMAGREARDSGVPVR